MKEHLVNGLQGAKAGAIATVVIWASALAMAGFTYVPGLLKGVQVIISGPLVNWILIIGLFFPLIGFIFGFILSVYMK